MTLVMPPFPKQVFKGHAVTAPGTMHVTFEVRIFSRFGAISI